MIKQIRNRGQSTFSASDNCTLTPVSRKWYDGYNAETGNVVDAKRYQNWPKDDLPFSLKEAGDDLALSDAVAADAGTNVEVIVATQEKADLLRRIAAQRGLENTVIGVKGR